MKRVISVLFAVLMCSFLCVPAFAVNTNYVFDISEVSIPEEKLDELNKAAKSISEKYDAEIYYIITDDITPCANTALYAKKAFENYTEDGTEGACFTYFIRENKSYLYCTDGVKAVIKEDMQNEIYNSFDNADSYFNAVDAFYKYLDGVFEKNGPIAKVSRNSDNSEEDTAEESLLPYVLDNTGILKTDERIKLNTKLKEYSEQCKCDICIVLVQSVDGSDIETYTDEFYKNNGYGYGGGKDGVMFLLNMEDRSWCVSRHGKCESVVSQENVNEMVSGVSGYLSKNDYYNAFDKFADDFLNKFRKRNKISLIWIPVDLAIGFIIAFFIMKAMIAGLTSVRSKNDADDYVADGSVSVNYRSDNFLYKNVERTPRPKNNNPGGGASGSSHSASSGKF